LAGIPFFGWQLFRSKSPRAVSALALFSILAVTATATLHNAVATSRSAGGTEFIAVSAQAGVTFAHGNSAGANGTYKPLDGVSASRLKQNKDAYQIVKQETGSEGWAHTSDYYLKQGLHYLSNNPGEAVQLFLSKIRWMFAAKHYGDLFFISEEIDDGAWPRPIPHYNFLQVGWLLPLSIVGLLLLWRKGHHASLTLALLFLSAAAVVVVFWYSPRYRLPLVPIAAIIAPWAAFSLARSRTSVLAAVLVMPVVFIEGSSALDNFDPRDDAMFGSFNFNTGLNYFELGQHDLAIPRFETAIAHGQDKAVTHLALGDSLYKMGKSIGARGNDLESVQQLDEAREHYHRANTLINKSIEHYYRALELNPTRDDARQTLANVLFFLKRDAEAKKVINEGKQNKSQ
jgi:tetratricopeptide (TPR) repeat protein